MERTPQMREPQAELMFAMRSSISRSAADGGRGSCAGCCSGAADARLHPLLLPTLPPTLRCSVNQGQGPVSPISLQLKDKSTTPA